MGAAVGLVALMALQTLVLVLVIRLADLNENEPLAAVLALCAWGASGAVLIAIVLDRLIVDQLSDRVDAVFGATLSAPPVEEAAATAAPVREAIERLAARGHRPAALFVDTAYTSDGVLAAGASYHGEVAEVARAAGAFIVADEVQAGYGRSGEHLWSFVACGLQPDLVTLGKPMGNGHPIAAVIARRDDVDRLAGQAEFFSTFGGNPVAAAAGLAVLDVIRDEQLVSHAAEVGARLRAGLEVLGDRHASIAAIRGRGLLLGVELVRPDDGAPDPELAARVLDGVRDRGVLIGSTGPHDNVLKVRPPLVVSPDEADMIVAAIDETLCS